MIPLEDDPEVFTDELFARNVTYILIIPKDYERNLLDGAYENLLEHYTVPGSNNAVFVDMQIEQYLNTTAAYLAAVEEKGTLFYAFLYLPYIFICITLVAVGPILSIMNSKEIKNRMTISCLKISYRLIGM